MPRGSRTLYQVVTFRARTSRPPLLFLVASMAVARKGAAYLQTSRLCKYVSNSYSSGSWFNQPARFTRSCCLGYITACSVAPLKAVCRIYNSIPLVTTGIHRATTHYEYLIPVLSASTSYWYYMISIVNNTSAQQCINRMPHIACTHRDGSSLLPSQQPLRVRREARHKHLQQ